jgi:Arc/MetJ family transcription regulator
MKKTLHIDSDLLKEARLASGAATDTATVSLGLQALVRKAAYESLRSFWGSEPDAQDVPRRREEPVAPARRRKVKRTA